MNDITSIINKYNKAPLFELEDVKCPKGGVAFFLPTFDSKQVRVSVWNINSAKGTIILQSGRTEFIEKYYEVISEFNERGFSVVSMDWRGQGLSDRTARDIKLGHIDSFSEYDKDFNNLLGVIEDITPKPWIGFGHSMGGCLVTSHFLKNDEKLSGLILSAPMLSVKIPNFMKEVTRYLGKINLLRIREIALNKPGWDDEKGWLEEPFDENQLTSDKKRYERTHNFISKYQQLGVKGISLGWANEAIKRTDLFAKNQYESQSNKPILLLSASEDKLVSPSANIKILSSYKNITIKKINCKHEVFMEIDSFREEAWVSVDKFLEAFTF